MRLVIVSGTSGSGKSVALHTLEDLGYYCIDNLPVFLLRDLALGFQSAPGEIFEQTAVGIDARSQPRHLRELPGLVAELREARVDCQVLFLDAQGETLIKRFSETRRKHPLSGDDRSLAEAIELERQLLKPILSDADLCIDTTHTNVHQLRELIRERFGAHQTAAMSILLQTFGFKHGTPRDADFVIDVRCLPNPHWQPDLRPLTGLHPAVAHFLESSPEALEMRDDLIAFFHRWLPRFEAEGRSYLTIAIGCTGGQHRSVYLGEQLRAHFAATGRKVLIRHRELP
ncbi:MAG: RNase adapter RapZ [Chromatiaceae bacterium]|jgi:UPF0042 nucleotide-binding protein|nr:RNase adapter RapZ [Chromatiaceae bacterium]